VVSSNDSSALVTDARAHGSGRYAMVVVMADVVVKMAVVVIADVVVEMVVMADVVIKTVVVVVDMVVVVFVIHHGDIVIVV